ncbi:MAG TPA: MBL fold metallo-hydrolase [Solirubrobacterales bacterium]|nr:MBL fold metallo-hydrolase [Solirubrobacterales bacterium]
MRVDWHGQSAFTLDGEAATVFVDPFGDMSAAASRGIEWGYPAIESPAGVDLLIVTHEHGDHNAVEVIDGEPALVRSVAGTHPGPLGDVVAIASEHDGAAGTERGPNTIVVFDLDGLRVAHFGDFGQPALRPEQRAHLDGIDLLFLPVGGGPTIDGATAAGIALDLGAPWVVPMHYKTDKINFLDTEEAFVEAMPGARRLSSSSFDTADLEKGAEPTAIVPAAP